MEMGIIDKIKLKRKELERKRIKKDKSALKKLDKQKKIEETRLQIRKKKKEIKDIKQSERGSSSGVRGILEKAGDAINKADLDNLFEESSAQSPSDSPPNPFSTSPKTKKKKAKKNKRKPRARAKKEPEEEHVDLW